MHIQADRLGLVVRLYDLAADNPNELNLVGQPDGRVSVGLEDRDGGDTHLEVTVTRAELVAALALMEAPLVSVDAPDGGVFRTAGAAPAPAAREAEVPPCPSCGSTEPDCAEGCAVRLETRAKDEARRIVVPGLNEDGEVVLELANGWTLRSGGESFTSGEYVRLVDPAGVESVYWDQEEWSNDPALVMGAILNAATTAGVS